MPRKITPPRLAYSLRLRIETLNQIRPQVDAATHEISILQLLTPLMTTTKIKIVCLVQLYCQETRKICSSRHRGYVLLVLSLCCAMQSNREYGGSAQRSTDHPGSTGNDDVTLRIFGISGNLCTVQTAETWKNWAVSRLKKGFELIYQ